MTKNAADTAMSDYVRKRDGNRCQVCLKPFGERAWDLHCSHFWKRGGNTRSVRYDEENAMAACKSCHDMLEKNADVHRAIFIRRLGQARFDALARRAHAIVKRNTEDVRAIAAEYRRRSAQEFGFYRGRGPALSSFVPDDFRQ